MAGKAYRWPASREEVLALIAPVLARHASTNDAAAELGCSDAALRGVCRSHRIDYAAHLQSRTIRAPATGPVVSSVPPPPEPGIDWRGARPITSAPSIERRIVVGDIHFPAHSASALAAVYALVRALQPHKVIQVGDLVNGAAFTHHGAFSPQAERYDLSMLAARGFIRSIKKAAPGAELYIIRGNHDDWASRYESENPGLEGSFDFETLLGIRAAPDDDRPPPFADVKVVRCAERTPLVLGPVAYAHGNGGGLHFAKRYAENNGPRAGVRVLRVGHHHTLQVYCHRNGHEAWGVGWVGNEDHPAFHYAPSPRGWWVGVLVEDIVGDTVTTTPVPIVNGVALFGGRMVRAA